jgi:flagellar basal-body rod protein FlgB
MLERIFSNPAIMVAQDALDGLSARHTAISDNIANVNTPGYIRREVPFEQQLSSAIQTSYNPWTGLKQQSVLPFTPMVQEDNSGAMQSDGNNVDIEREMVMMAENSIRYEALTEYVGSFYSGLKTVINS